MENQVNKCEVMEVTEKQISLMLKQRTGSSYPTKSYIKLYNL